MDNRSSRSRVTAFRYRAFMSYSHRDRRAGEWLHRSLENYRIPKLLVGRSTENGEIPRSLRPIFRDRWDLSASHSLTEKIDAALSQSQFLIVLCSPAAAQSAYVNEEVRRFKERGGAERVLALIIDGEPGDPDQECFPPALKFEVTSDGLITDKPEEPIAADARPQGDGRPLALLKVIGGLLGVELDELRRREEVAQRKRQNFRNGVISVLLFLLVVASGSLVYGYQQLRQNEELLDQAIEIAYGIVTEATELSDQVGFSTSATLSLLKRAEKELNKLFEKGTESPRLQYRQAQMALAFSDSYQTLDQSEEGQARVAEAEKILKGLVNQDPENLDWQWAYSGAVCRTAWPQINSGQMEDAVTRLEQCQSLRAKISEKRPDNREWRSMAVAGQAQLEAFQVFFDRGNSTLQRVRETIQELERLASESPDDYELQLRSASVYDIFIFVLRRDGRIDEAIQVSEKRNQLYAKLAKRYRRKKSVQVGYATSLAALGELLSSQGQNEKALPLLEKAEKELSESVKRDPDNTSLVGQLIAVLHNLANSYLTTNEPERAREILERAVSRSQDLQRNNPENILWSTNLMTSYRLLGDAIGHRGDRAEAIEMLDTAMTFLSDVTARIQDSHPSIKVASAEEYQNLGLVYLRLNAWEKGAKLLKAASETNESALKTDAGNTPAKRSLAFNKHNEAFAQRRMGNADLAVALYHEAVAIRRALAMTSPDSAQSWENLANSLEQLSHTYSELRKYDAASRHAEDERSARAKVVPLRPDDAAAKEKLLFANVRFATAKRRLDDRPEERRAFEEASIIARSQFFLTPSDKTWFDHFFETSKAVAQLYQRDSKWTEALGQWRQLVSDLERAAPGFSDPETLASRMAATRASAALILQRLERGREAEAEFRRSLGIAKEWVERSNSPSKWRLDVAQVNGQLGFNLLSQNRAKEAIEFFDEAYALARTESAAAPKSQAWFSELMSSLEGRHHSYAILRETEGVQQIDAERILTLKEKLELDKEDASWQRYAVGVATVQAQDFHKEKKTKLANETFGLVRDAIKLQLVKTLESPDWIARFATLYAKAEASYDVDTAIRHLTDLRAYLERALPALPDKSDQIKVLMLDTADRLWQQHKRKAQPEEALSVLQWATEIKISAKFPDHGSPRLGKLSWRLHQVAGELEEKIGRPDKAITYYRAAVRQAEKLIEAGEGPDEGKAELVASLSHLAIVNRSQRQYDQAVEGFTRAYGVAQQLPNGFKYNIYHGNFAAHARNVLFERGRTYRNAGKFDLALKDIEKALVDQPDWLEGLEERALVLGGLGRNQEELAQYHEILAKQPDRTFARERRASLLMKQNAWKEALVDLDWLVEETPASAKFRNARAWAHFKLGQLEKGLADADKSLSLSPEDAYSLDTRAHILEALGRTEEALSDYRNALRVNPDLEEAKAGLARLGGTP